MRILDLLVKERINLNLQSSTKSDVIKEIAWSFEETKVLNHYDDFVTAVNAREALSSTALEEGIAIPHAKTSAIKKAAVAIGRKLDGIDYDSLDGEKSQLFFMIGAPDGANNEHIEVLAKLSQLLLDDDFRLALLKANSAEEVMSLIDRKETEKAEEAKNVVVNTNADYIVAVTACPTGIAHTYMAEEALKKAAKEMGVNIKVETNGTDGTKNLLTAEEIKKAKGVILAVDRNVETNRFSGKKVIKTGAKDGINNAKKLIQRVLDGDAPIFAGDGSNAEGSAAGETAKEGLGLYKHLMSGVSFMLPLVVSGGILIAFAFLADSLLGFADAGAKYGSSSDLAKYFMTIGGAAFGLFVPILGGYIAYSIAERPGLTPGLVAGALAASGGSGFLGAMVGGFLAGYVVKLVIYLLKGMPKSLNGIKAILLYPVLSVLITGLAMLLILNPVVGGINNGLTNFLNSMSGSSKVLLGLIVGGMMAVDMGGPVNKAAYVFGVGTLAASQATGGSATMAAVMAGGMVPPLAIALATTVFRNKFTIEEKEAGKTNYIMGLSFITEGAIPFAAGDPLRVIPSMIVGSALAGALTMLFDIKLRAPHGGILVMFLSNNFLMYLVAVIAGSIVSAILLGILKPKLK